MGLFSRKNKKALIIGIDGVPRDLLLRMVERGVMKGLKGILDHGYRIHPMRASLPEISSVSWTSFMTGVNPGEHGIFGFTHLEPASYRLHFTNSRDIKAPTFWQTLSKKGKIKKTVVLNIPSTYPAFPIDGLLVSGFVAVDFEKAIYPSSYVSFLRDMNYIIDVDAEKGRNDKPGLYQDILQSLTTRRNVSLALFEREPWDLSVFCVTETDRLHHFFFDENDTATFDTVYTMIDQLVTELYEAAKRKWGEEFLFLLLSDHGFSVLKKEVNLNAYLRKAGMLTLDSAREYYERIGSGTVAFAMDPGRIYVHEEKKYPRGHVRVDQRHGIREKLKDLLFDLKDEGEPVIQSIFEREDLYQGPYREAGPDLVCIPRPGYDLKGNLRKEEVFTVDVFKGMHTWENAVLLLPEQITIDAPINIEFPAKVILDYFFEKTRMP
jgi:predicted AlkP superfamily phosphohydrolase/phosphomutase